MRRTDIYYSVGLRIRQRQLNSQPVKAGKMKHSFYDVKVKKKIDAEVTEKVTFGEKGKERYAFKAKTGDGRSLTAFVTKSVWGKAKI